MLRKLFVLSLATLTGVAWSAAAYAATTVVATLPDLACVAREVGGPDVSVTALAEPTQDPHFVDAKPSLILPLNRADLLVLTGLQLEVGWLPTLITGARNPRIQPSGQANISGYFDASTVCQLKQVPTQQVNRSMGDLHPGGNPHYMMDPREGARVARAMADRLSQIDPAHRAGFQQRAGTLAAACEKLGAKEIKRFAGLPAERRKAVVYHQSMIYLLDWLGVEQVDTLEPKPGLPPSPDHVAAVMVRMKQEKVPVLLHEDYRPKNVGALVAGKVGARQVVIPGGPNFNGGQRYLDYLQDVANKLYDGLKP